MNTGRENKHKNEQLNRQDLGHWGRKKIREYFEAKGYQVIRECWQIKDQNGKKIFGLGEVDLLLMNVSKNRALMLEVKTRKSVFSQEGILSKSQILRLRRSYAFVQKAYPYLKLDWGLAIVEAPEGKLEFLWNPCYS